jgi:hypothetical protein
MNRGLRSYKSPLGFIYNARTSEALAEKIEHSVRDAVEISIKNCNVLRTGMFA